MKVQFTLEVDLEGFETNEVDRENVAREILYSAPAFDGKDWIDHLEFTGVADMTEMFPVDVGATIKVDDDEVFRVTNIWIDEDGNPQVTITHGTHNESITYSDIVEKWEQGDVERTNSGHEAAMWRRR